MSASIAETIRDKSDAIVAVSVVVVILIMIVPLNKFLIDMFITISISTSLIILLMGMYTQRALDFSAFPSVLLIVTLFRLCSILHPPALSFCTAMRGSARRGA